MKVSVTFKPNKKTENKLKNAPNKVTYEIARRTLDLTVPHIPMNTGKMRATSTSAGVRGKDGDYWIGSYTSYAIKVWYYKDVHWTTPSTFGKWYEEIWRKHKSSIEKNVLERNKL